MKMMRQASSPVLRGLDKQKARETAANFAHLLLHTVRPAFLSEKRPEN